VWQPNPSPIPRPDNLIVLQTAPSPDPVDSQTDRQWQPNSVEQTDPAWTGNGPDSWTQTDWTADNWRDGQYSGQTAVWPSQKATQPRTSLCQTILDRQTLLARSIGWQLLCGWTGNWPVTVTGRTPVLTAHYCGLTDRYPAVLLWLWYCVTVVYWWRPLLLFIIVDLTVLLLTDLVVIVTVIHCIIIWTANDPVTDHWTCVFWNCVLLVEADLMANWTMTIDNVAMANSPNWQIMSIVMNVTTSNVKIINSYYYCVDGHCCVCGPVIVCWWVIVDIVIINNCIVLVRTCIIGIIDRRTVTQWTGQPALLWPMTYCYWYWPIGKYDLTIGDYYCGLLLIIIEGQLLCYYYCVCIVCVKVLTDRTLLLWRQYRAHLPLPYIINDNDNVSNVDNMNVKANEPRKPMTNGEDDVVRRTDGQWPKRND